MTPGKKPKKINPAEKIESQIWKAADQLRGNLEAAEYKSVVLGLIFLKFISDKFEQRHAELVADDEGFEEDVDFYTSERVFFVPEEARWEVISKAAHTPEIGTVIDVAMIAIERSNPKLKGILPKDFSRPELDKHRLGNIIDIFTNLSLINHDDEQDLFGLVYEYCLGKFAENEGKNAGQFYTPTSIVKLLVEILQPYKGRIYDPACGSGGMFVQSAKFIQAHHGNLKNISIYGQEYNSNTWKLAQLNLAIRGIEANFGDTFGDTFTQDQHKHEKFDFIIANPPFNLKEWGYDTLQDDPRWKFGVPPKGNANFAWIQHMIHHLADSGKIGLVLSNGALSSEGDEGRIRKALLEADLVESIVSLPNQLFFNTSIPVSLWFFTNKKSEKAKGKVLFMDVTKMGSLVSRKQIELTDEDIQIIVDTFDKYKSEGTIDEAGFAKTVTNQEIATKAYALNPGRYIEETVNEDDESFEEKMQLLTTGLSDLFDKSDNLTIQIKTQLGALGFDC